MSKRLWPIRMLKSPRSGLSLQKAPLAYGDQISIGVADEILTWVDWPKDAVPAGAFTKSEELLGPGNSETRTVLRTIEPGELVLKSKVTGFGESARVATQVADGKRAFSIPIDAVSGVAGLVAPGDRVDILLTRSINRQLSSSIILQNILVIATDQTSNQDSSTPRLATTATVEVNPTEAQKLALAQQVGKLSLSLRGMGELAGQSETAPVGMSDLPNQPEVVEKPEAVQRTIRVRKGAEVKEVVVD